jgi:hypothetical protein
MQKNSLTNKLTPCCVLPFKQMYFWLSNIKLNSESQREFIISRLSQSGELANDGWIVLMNSGELEDDATLTKEEMLAFVDCKKSPSCSELKIIIENYKLGSWLPDAEEKILYDNNFLTAKESEASDILMRIDYEEGFLYTLKEEDKWYDGSDLNDSLIDNEIYKKRLDKFYKKQISKNLLIKIDTIAELRQTNGYYEGQEIILLGYYESGDKDPVHYKFTVQHYSSAVDNGGLTIKTDRGVWIAQLNGKCDIKDFGAVKDTDCTVILNKALELVDEVVISDRYKVNPIGYVPSGALPFRLTGGVKPRSGNILRSVVDEAFYIDPNSETHYAIVNCERISNAKLIGLNIRGDVDTHTGTTGEHGYGISISGCTDVDIINCKPTHCWGDGVNLGTSKLGIGDAVVNTRVNIYNLEADYNRRNGLSIESNVGGKLYNISTRFNGTINGINPRYGFVVEPNNGGDDAIDVWVDKLYTEGNSEGGLEVVCAYMQDIRYTTPGLFKFKLTNWLSKDDAVSSEGRGTLRTVFAALGTNIVETKPINGFVDISNVTIENSGKGPVKFSRVPDNGMAISLTNTKIINPCVLVPEQQYEINNALSFLTDDNSTSYGKILVDGFHVQTNLTTNVTGIYFKPNNSEPFKNVTVRNFSYDGIWTNVNEVPTYGNVDSSVLLQFSSVPKITLSTSGVLRDYSVTDYMEVTMTAQGTVRALPDSTKVKRKRIKYIADIAADQICYLEGKNDTQPINISPRNSRRIALTGGSSVTVDLASDGTWDIIDFSGTIYNDGFPPKGTTAQRPTGLTSADAGFRYYDTTLGNYITWNGYAFIKAYKSDYRVISGTAYTLSVTNNIEVVEINTSGTGTFELTIGTSSNAVINSKIVLINNTNNEIVLKNVPGVSIMGVTTPYTNTIMLKSREVVTLYCNADNSWRFYNENRIANHVADVTLSDASATYGASEQALINELKSKINLILSTERTAGQRSNS